MLKKYVSWLFLAVCLLTASLSYATPTAILTNYKFNSQSFLTYKLVNNEPITYCIYLNKQSRSFTNPKDFDDTFKLAVKWWMAHTAQLIRLSGQEKELAPVLAVLEKEPNLQLLPKCDFSKYKTGNLADLEFQPSGKKVPSADLSLFVEDRYFAHMERLDKIRAFFSTTPIRHIVIPSAVYYHNPADVNTFGDTAKQFIALRKQILATPNSDFKQMNTLLSQLMQLLAPSQIKQRSLLYVLQHELGHSFGLADQKRSSNNGDLLEGSIELRPGIMDNFSTFLSCDDADGLVLSLHKTMNLTNERFYSFCQDGVRFYGGKEEISSPKKSVTSEGDTLRTRTYYPNTATDGIYFLEEKSYVNTSSEETSQKIHPLFDRSLMPKGEGGYQNTRGKMKIIDSTQPDKSVPVGEHTIQITLGAGPLHKQVLHAKYDDNGQPLSYTLQIYGEDEILLDSRSKTF